MRLYSVFLVLALALILTNGVAAQSDTVAPQVDPAALEPAKATEKAPEAYRVRLDTTKGPVVIEVIRQWSPLGADRFYNLVNMGFFTDVAFFRVLPGFMAQFGIHGDPAVSDKWKDAGIPDEPVKQSNQRGFLTFAMSNRPSSRTTQLFINYTDNAQLDNRKFAPIGRVIMGMDVVDILFADYGEGAPSGTGPDQRLIESKGNAYLRQSFPNLDYIKSAKVMR